MMIDLHNCIEKYKMNITGVVHVGAHYGEEYNSYKKISSIKNIVFFEPDKDSFLILKENIKNAENVICINKALGPFSCEAYLHKEQDNQGQSNSLLEPYLHVQQYPYIKFTNKVKVNVEPLDKYQPDMSLNFLNMDVQGSELNVLLGASNTLKNNIQYIITEINRAELYKNCAMVEDLDYFLGKFNFKRVETVWDRDSSTWGDALYIKSDEHTN